MFQISELNLSYLNITVMLEVVFFFYRLVTIGIPPFHFSYVFVDECGQAIEPEALIPVSRIFTDITTNINRQLVLAGDPKQLGPILRSRLASEMGLGKLFFVV